MHKFSTPHAGCGYSWLLPGGGRTASYGSVRLVGEGVLDPTIPYTPVPNPVPTSTTSAKGLGGVGSPHRLYRFFDAEDNLLYVGRSCRLAFRMKAHEKDARWSLVARVELETVESAERLEMLEEFAIVSERPRWNRAMVPEVNLSPGDEHFVRCLRAGQTIYLNNGEAGTVLAEVEDDDDRPMVFVHWENEDEPRWTHPRAIQMSYGDCWGKSVGGPVW